MQATDQRALKGLGTVDPTLLAALPKMISTDSHLAEPDRLWAQLPARLRENLPKIRFDGSPPEGSNPKARLAAQVEDGIQAEIMYPNYGMALFGLDDIETQREGFRLYNDWAADFCSTAPRNLFAVPCLSVYDINGAIKEMHRAHDMGLIGAMVWQVADPRLPFTSDHYELLWAAAAEADAPIICHILTGHSYARNLQKSVGDERIRDAVNRKQNDTNNTLFDFIFSGAFDRHPKLRLLLAESEIGWVPYVLQQWDYYFERFRKQQPLRITRLPSEIFAEHVYCTFLEDFVGTRTLSWWGQKNCMWSNDYPHFNMTYPYSRQNVVKHLGDLPESVRLRLIRDNAIELFNLKI